MFDYQRQKFLPNVFFGWSAADTELILTPPLTVDPGPSIPANPEINPIGAGPIVYVDVLV